MWFKNDHFSYAWKKMTGNFILTARFSFMGDGANPHRKAGWMVRKTLDRNSPYADAVVHGDGLASLQFRQDFDNDTEEKAAGIAAPDIIQFERIENKFIMRAARFGDPLETTASVELDLGEPVYAGLAICSHEDDIFEKAVVSNLRIEIPAPSDARPYQDYSGSRMEILDIETGLRKIVLESENPFEAPNWTRDGQSLIYNSQGLLYRFDLANGISTKIDTGPAERNNNDHVISWGGGMLGISHHMESDTASGSTISIIPVEGGNPRMVTDKAPSYLHGWSTDDRFLVYTARRNGQYDIYQISVDGGNEIQLTDQVTLDDGSEYSPDGNWIYFNSARSGTMQVWRMRTNGENQEQLTFDQWNDWFPHISPDGKTILFLSYPPEIDAQDHPHYKHVMLRTMPFNGGTPKVAAYLYGGQGTINVPSWSPDSKKAAFVSYSF
ncbi:MAG: biopolymer transporter TolR [Acidobacteriota bacterium]